MRERTKSRLTTFSRLWAIPMILCIALSIVGVIGCMDEQKNLIGIGATGSVLMFLIMLCQLVTSIMVRRWWCMVGVIIGIVVSLFVWVCSIVALAAGQYRPPVREETSDTIVVCMEQEQINY